ncbi:reverse transcriptase domain-containing protein [Tanacetum coccineum]|uniref:Reverse transcriptase domain-containing protein n=1 Tax=Tanacetum coccineum TaxID=301880 RepID=A0ABQ4XNI7_9ASTR
MDYVNMFDSVTLSDAYQRALAFEKQNLRFGSSSSPAITGGGSGSSNVASHFVPNQARQSGGSGLKCFNCGEPGHRQSECKKARKKALFVEPGEWEDYGVANDNYEGAPVFDDDQYEEEVVTGDVGVNLMVSVKITLIPNKPKELVNKPTSTLLTLSQVEGKLEVDFEVVDFVWAVLTKDHFPVGEYNKLSAKKIDPLEIVEKINSNAYRLKLPSHIRYSDVFNVKHLLPYHGPSVEERALLFLEARDRAKKMPCSFLLTKSFLLIKFISADSTSFLLIKFISADNSVMSDSEGSAVTYTSVYTDSEPGRVFWGTDEEVSEGDVPRVILYGYDGFPIQPVPQDEDEREPAFIQAHTLDFPLPPVDSPTAESPGYIAESDPDEDPEYEDDEEQDGPVDYSMGGGDDGGDDDGDLSGDDADDEDKDMEKDDEDEDGDMEKDDDDEDEDMEKDDEDEEEEEEEKHIASADSTAVIPIVELVSSPEGTKPIIPPLGPGFQSGFRHPCPFHLRQMSRDF